VNFFPSTGLLSTIFNHAAPLGMHAAATSSAHRVGSDVGRPCATVQAVTGQATPYCRWAVQAACPVRVGQPRGFQPMDSILNRNPFLFFQFQFKFKL
jgi:hypothetical protein